jgi:hypothetical protein
MKIISLLLLALPLAAQSSAHINLQTNGDTSITKQKPKQMVEILMTSSLRPDGNADVRLFMAGLNGVEITQEKSRENRKVVSKISMPPIAFRNATNLRQADLVLEKELNTDHIVVSFSFFDGTERSVRIILPVDSKPLTSTIQMETIPSKPFDDGEGSGGGNDCIRTSYTSERCGTISACCPTVATNIDGVNCTISCR